MISFNQVNKTYNKKNKALIDLTFDLKPGITGFIGLNGAGKSTTINILSGLLSVDTGEVKILDNPIKAGDWKYKSEVGFVLEKASYLENLTGQEYLTFAGIMYNMDKKLIDNRVKELIEYFELPYDDNKQIKEYSKGMKKKISLSCALLNNPKLLVLDEPLEGLDPISINRAKKLLLQLKSTGVSIFISSHELGTIEEICDDIIIINKGLKVFQGNFDELIEFSGLSVQEAKSISLEELFVKLVGDNSEKKLSWV